MEISDPVDHTPDQDTWDEVTAADDAAVSLPGDDQLADVPAPPAADAAAAPAPAPADAPADPAATTEVDPLASVPEHYRAAILGYSEMNQRLRSSEGRIAALQRELAQRPAAPAPTPAAPQSSRLDALRAELPEVVEAIEEFRGQIPSVDTDQLRADLRMELQEELLESHDASWATKLTSNDFQIWLAAQPADYQQRINNSNKASDLIGALNKYSGHQQVVEQRTAELQSRQRRVSRAVTPTSSRGGRPPHARSEDELTADELWDEATR